MWITLKNVDNCGKLGLHICVYGGTLKRLQRSRMGSFSLTSLCIGVILVSMDNPITEKNYYGWIATLASALEWGRRVPPTTSKEVSRRKYAIRSALLCIEQLTAKIQKKNI